MVSVGLSHSDGSWISRAIDRESGGLGFTHAYLIFHGLNLVFEAHACLGVRFVDRAVSASDLVIALTADPQEEAQMLRRACLMAGDKYDYCGVVHNAEVGKLIEPTPGDEFCSEAVVIVGQAASKFPGLTAGNVSPNDLYLHLK